MKFKKAIISVLLATLILSSIFIVGCGPAPFKVQFNGNGGEWVDGGATIQHVTSATQIVEPVYKKKGYNQLGYSHVLSEITSDTSVDVVWSAKRWTDISLDRNGGNTQDGNVEFQPVSLTYGQYVPILPQLTKDGNYFKGWAIVKNSVKTNMRITTETTLDYDINENEIGVAEEDRSAITGLVAEWGVIPTGENIINYKYNGTDSTSFNTLPKTYVENASTEEGATILPTPIKDGYVFLGWSYDEAGEQIIEDGVILNKSGELTVHANWSNEMVEFNLTFTLMNVNRDGSYYNQTEQAPEGVFTVKYGESMGEQFPNGELTPKKSEYNLSHWVIAHNNEEIVISRDTVFNEKTFYGITRREDKNLLVYAKCFKGYKISFSNTTYPDKNGETRSVTANLNQPLNDIFVRKGGTIHPDKLQAPTMPATFVENMGTYTLITTYEFRYWMYVVKVTEMDENDNPIEVTKKIRISPQFNLGVTSLFTEEMEIVLYPVIEVVTTIETH